MSREYRVLVTGVGAIIGYGLINCLKRSKYNVYVVGMDIYEDAYGREICDEFIQAKYACDPDYPNFIKKIMSEKNIDLVLFGTEQEITRLSQAKDEMGEYYNRLVINNPDVLTLSEDKWSTYQFLVENGFEAIPSRIEGGYKEIATQFGTPFLLKPRQSYACKGIEKISTEEEFDFFKKRSGEQFMVQKIIGDIEHEYTAAVFGDGVGGSTKPIILKRKLSQEGATAKAETISSPEIERMIKSYCKLLKPIGPTNFQFRSEGEKFYLLEINPRISSSTSIREAFGYNEAEMCIRFWVEREKVEDCKLKEGRAIRYIADWVEIK